MTEEDVDDARALDLMINVNTPLQQQYLPGVRHVPFRGKCFVIAKWNRGGRIIVMGMKDADYDGTENLFEWVL